MRSLIVAVLTVATFIVIGATASPAEARSTAWESHTR